jgi:hypothetical protein
MSRFAPGSQLPAPGSRLPAPSSQLPAPSSQLPAPSSQLVLGCCGNLVKLFSYGTKVFSLIPHDFHPYTLKEFWPV